MWDRNHHNPQCRCLICPKRHYETPRLRCCSVLRMANVMYIPASFVVYLTDKSYAHFSHTEARWCTIHHNGAVAIMIATTVPIPEHACSIAKKYYMNEIYLKVSRRVGSKQLQCAASHIYRVNNLFCLSLTVAGLTFRPFLEFSSLGDSSSNESTRILCIPWPGSEDKR